MPIKKKYRKLLRDPKLFFSDMLIKHSKLLNIIKGVKKYKGKNQFTVISPVYNVEKYLDDYFVSLINQSLNFTKHLHLVLVDDGSTDASASIIKKWQKKYPNNITYIYQKNGGQSSARNLGLKFLKTDWVTFIDPDDFVSQDYFQVIDQYVSLQDESLVMMSTSIYFYLEKENIYKDSHPLNFRFKQTSKFKISEMKQYFECSVAKSFFKLRNSKLKFNKSMGDFFEDSDFVNRFLVLHETCDIAFLPKAKYFYRKRGDKSSKLDHAFSNKDFYTKTLREGCLRLLEDIQNKKKFVPAYAQNAVLYHLVPYFKKYLNHRDAPVILSEDERCELLNLIKKIFAYIDTKTIWSFNLNGCSVALRIAFIEYFKEEKTPAYNVYVEDYDQVNNQILISYFSYLPVNITIQIDKKEVLEDVNKIVSYEFCNKTIVYENRLWVSIHDGQFLKVLLNNKDTRIFLGKDISKGQFNLSVLKKIKTQTYTNDIWFLMDRDIQADDNAEHLYRYIMKNHPSQECYFALKKESHDWKRLTKEGFKLIEFGSMEFETLLKTCSKVVSSHSFATNYFGGNSLQRDFVFLQHGVIHNDHSAFFNGRSNLTCFVTTTKDEYDAISGNNSHYKMTPKEVVLTGLPRHDALLMGNNQESRQLLIMPTWRRSIVGESTGSGLARNKNDLFLETEYAKNWSKVLNSQELKMMADKYGFEVVFAPHAEVEKYLNILTVPSYIKIWRAESCSIQSLFQNSSIMLTDYSSVAFDMAFLKKSTVYFQFDRHEFYGDHYRKDYFNYDDNGFGPVVFNVNQLLLELELLMKNNGKPSSLYLQRMEKSFLFRDGKNCERVYESICNLDKTRLFSKADVYKTKINNADQMKNWSMLKKFSSLFSKVATSECDKKLAFDALFKALCKRCDWVGLERMLYKFNNHANYSLTKTPLLLAKSKWSLAMKYFGNMDDKSNSAILFYYLLCHAELKNSDLVLSYLQNRDTAQREYVYFQILHDLSMRNWRSIVKRIIKQGNTNELLNLPWQDYSFELLLARAYYNLYEYEKALKVLDSYQLPSTFELNSRFLKAEIYFKLNKMKVVVSLLEPILKREGHDYFTNELINIYCESLYSLEEYKKLSNFLIECSDEFKNSTEYYSVQIKTLEKMGQWNNILLLYNQQNELNNSSKAVRFCVSKAYFATGNTQRAYQILSNLLYEKNNYELTKFLAILAWVEHDYSSAEYLLKQLITRFSNQETDINWNLYNQFLLIKNSLLAIQDK